MGWSKKFFAACLLSLVPYTAVWAASGSSKNIPGDYITRSNRATLALPSTSDTIPGRATTDTFTNKTYTIGTASRVLQTNASGNLEASSTIDTTELGFLDGVTSSLCGINQSCTLTSKTLTSPAINTATMSAPAVSDYIAATETTDPATPSAGSRRMYAKSDGFYQIDSAGLISKVGSGSGSGGLNFVVLNSALDPSLTSQSDFETTAIGWTAYADAAGTAPVDATGGSPTVTCARTTTGAEVGNGVGSLKITKDAANRQGEGCSLLVYIPPQYRGNVLSLSVPATLITGTWVQSDVIPYLYDVTNSQLITGTAQQYFVGSKPRVLYTFTTSTTMAQARIAIHYATTSAAAHEFSIDDVKLDPNSYVTGMAGSNFTTVTATFGSEWGTPSDKFYSYRRVGDVLEVEGFVIAGTTTGGNASIPLLTDCGAVNIDTAKYSATSGTAFIGQAHRSATTTDQGFHVFVDPSIAGSVFLGRDAVAASSKLAKIATSTYFSSGDLMAFKFKVKISGWDANVTMGANSTFKMSSYLASGSRVTGSAPTSLGQYRSYLRNSSARTYTETNGSPTATPSVTDGIKLYGGNAWGSADSNNEPSYYEIFVGKNKFIDWNFYQSASRTGAVNVQNYPAASGLDTTSDYGAVTSYDPTTGVASIILPRTSASTVGGNFGTTVDFASAVKDGFFDIVVSNNPQFVGVQSVRSQVRLSNGNGHGSTNNKIRRFTTTIENTGTAITYADSATAGASFTINEDGLYAISYTDYRSGTGFDFGVSRNSTQLTTTIQSITNADILLLTNNASDHPATASGSFLLRAGDVIRPHTDGAIATTDVYSRFTITKVAN